jgi:hypothetical protein
MSMACRAICFTVMGAGQYHPAKSAALTDNSESVVGPRELPLRARSA